MNSNEDKQCICNSATLEKCKLVNSGEGSLLNGLKKAALPLQIIGEYQSIISACNAYIQCPAGNQMLLQP